MKQRSYRVTGNFSKRRAKSCIAIQPPVGVNVTIYPTQALPEDTANYVISGVSTSAPMTVREYENSNVLQHGDTFGLALYNAQGVQTYHSSVKPIRVIGEFRSAPYNIPNNQSRVNDDNHYINSTRFLNDVMFPPGRTPENTALFISSIGAEGGMARKDIVTMSGGYLIFKYYRVRPLLKVQADRVSFGFSSEYVTSTQVMDDDGFYYYDGGVGHTAGFFIDVTDY